MLFQRLTRGLFRLHFRFQREIHMFIPLLANQEH
jgi:hypothetical protein